MLTRYPLVLLAVIYFIQTSFGIIKTCNINDYGAKGDGKTLNTKAIQDAIADCAKASAASNSDRSLVVLPSLSSQETVYVSGALWLESNLEFKIESNVRLLGTEDKSNETYPFIYTRREGTMVMTKSSLLNGGLCTKINFNSSAIGDQCKNNWKTLKNIKIYGYGTIDGNGHSGWYNAPYTNIRPCLVQLMWIDGLTVFNVTLTNSPFWTLHPLFSNNILIENITINTVGPNTDGVDPDSCSNVLVQNSYITTGDDCIAIKSGKDADGLSVAIPTNNVTIRDMQFGSGHGISIGSEMSGNVTNVLFENFRMDATQRGPRIKSQRGRGGLVSNVTYKDISMSGVSTGISVSEFYSSTATGIAPIFENIYILNLTGSVTDLAGEFLCLPESPCYNIVLDGDHITGYKNGNGFKCENAYGSASNTDPQSCLKTTNL